MHRIKLYSIMDYSVNEGLFAKAVVLVEGDIGRAGILAASENNGLSLDDRGVSVIRCRGKANLARLAIIFRMFGIETYIVWDADQGKRGNPKEIEQRARGNRELQRVVGWDASCALTTRIEDGFACIETDLEQQVKVEMGDFHGRSMETTLDRYGMSGKDKAIKHHVVSTDMLIEGQAYGATSPTLDAIIKKIAKLMERL